MRDPIQKILDLTSQEVALLGERERKRLLTALKQVEDELSIGLRGWLRAKRDGTARFTLKELRDVLLATRGARERAEVLGADVTDSLASARRASGGLSLKHLNMQYEALVALKEGRAGFLNLDTAAVLSRSESLLASKHRRSATRYSRDTRDWIKRQLSVGIIKNETIDQMVGRILRMTGPKKVGEIVTRESDIAVNLSRAILRSPRSWASRLVRTEALNAYNTVHDNAIKQMAKEDPAFMKRWDSSLDRRGCTTCRDLDGEVVKPGKEFSSGVMHPPQHPNCRCTVVPWMSHWEYDSVESEGTEGTSPPDPQPITWAKGQRPRT